MRHYLMRDPSRIEEIHVLQTDGNVHLIERYDSITEEWYEEKVNAAFIYPEGDIHHALSLRGFQQVHSELEKEIDEALGLQTVSLRLSVDVIAAFTKLAAEHGIGVLPMMRMALTRAARVEVQ